MSTVILSIDGIEVYKSSTSSSVSNETIIYKVVENPDIGSEYYYLAGYDENSNQVYKNGKLKDIKSEQDGPQSTKYIYIFDNGHKANDRIYKPVTSGGGGKSRRRKLRK